MLPLIKISSSPFFFLPAISGKAEDLTVLVLQHIPDSSFCVTAPKAGGRRQCGSTAPGHWCLPSPAGTWAAYPAGRCSPGKRRSDPQSDVRRGQTRVWRPDPPPPVPSAPYSTGWRRSVCPWESGAIMRGHFPNVRSRAKNRPSAVSKGRGPAAQQRNQSKISALSSSPIASLRYVSVSPS